jgi:hypothetical protein
MQVDNRAWPGGGGARLGPRAGAAPRHPLYRTGDERPLPEVDRQRARRLRHHDRGPALGAQRTTQRGGRLTTLPGSSTLTPVNQLLLPEDQVLGEVGARAGGPTSTRPGGVAAAQSSRLHLAFRVGAAGAETPVNLAYRI